MRERTIVLTSWKSWFRQLRSRLNFTISGSNAEDIKRKSILVVAQFLDSHDLDAVESKVEFEVEAKATPGQSEDAYYPLVDQFFATVWAKIKQ